jgi:hypothetical protein
VPAAKQVDLRAEDDESAQKLAALKAAIEATRLPTPPLKNYPCRYAGLKINWRLAKLERVGRAGDVSPPSGLKINWRPAKLEMHDADWQALEEIARDGLVDPQEYAELNPHLRELTHRFSTVHLDRLQEFGEQVREWLWESIRRRLNLPDQPPAATLAAADPLAEERDFHERFMESRLRVYVGREKISRALTKFADGEATVPCLVTGPSGSGKSAALAKFVTAYQGTHPNVLVLPHFIGASPTSTSL